MSTFIHLLSASKTCSGVQVGMSGKVRGRSFDETETINFWTCNGSLLFNIKQRKKSQIGLSWEILSWENSV